MFTRYNSKSLWYYSNSLWYISNSLGTTATHSVQQQLTLVQQQLTLVQQQLTLRLKCYTCEYTLTVSCFVFIPETSKQLSYYIRHNNIHVVSSRIVFFYLKQNHNNRRHSRLVLRSWMTVHTICDRTDDNNNKPNCKNNVRTKKTRRKKEKLTNKKEQAKLPIFGVF